MDLFKKILDLNVFGMLNEGFIAIDSGDAVDQHLSMGNLKGQ